MSFRAAVLILGFRAAALAAESPGDAALSFVRGLAGEQGVVRLEQSALDGGTTEKRRGEIESRLKRLGRGIRPDELRVLEEKIDGELAAVLLAQVNVNDVASVQVHAIGLVRSEDRWRPAPVPASFDSTGLSFRPGLLQRARDLETWMLHARGRHWVRLKNDAFALLRDAMLKESDLDELHESTPEQVVADFLAALRARSLPGALALVGGLEHPLPPEWDDSLVAIKRAFTASGEPHREWRLLSAPDALREIVLSGVDDTDAVVSIVALDPAADWRERPSARVMHVSLNRAKGGSWRILLPQVLLDPVGRELGRVDERLDEVDAFDAELLTRFPEKLRERIPAACEATPRAAAEALLKAFREPGLESLIARLDLSGEAAPALATLHRAARIWQRCRRPDDAAMPVLLDVHEVGDDACVLVQMFSAKPPDKASLEAFFLRRGSAGWTTSPGLTRASGLGQSLQAEGIRGWLAAARKARERDWSVGLPTRLGGIAADSAPSEAEARRVVEEWRAAIVDGDVRGMLVRSACFDDHAGASRLLRNSGYELQARQRGEIIGCHRSGRWAAISMRVPPVPGDDSADAYPLHIVIASDEGPRVLSELDLFDPLTRGRDFLNRRVWERIAARLPDGARGELEAVFDKHRALAAADRAKGPPSSQ
ncbi:MAG: hypothetical protein EAZ65_04640 [Verrucomicrobia bacterium]|nr:MAG: hypothetical protein EAZ84_00855 [Verrucomicrobiota bacterium]TAE88030.1 MAG: hypothetical protein EAZ82_05890 [Verrucomicrobiota bacterium]TAF26253.1 MAG: hypothetical protein EAZ71_05455 [Verrucomicrobiota bacterium]TAF41808.1 MAG: hypothetical protein EAZ65_04640 [Verrucomicrobiota bacterium]